MKIFLSMFMCVGLFTFKLTIYFILQTRLKMAATGGSDEVEKLFLDDILFETNYEYTPIKLTHV